MESRIQATAASVYQHPKRFPGNVPGPFYTLGCLSSCGTWVGECLACEAPEAEAPDLLTPLKNGNIHTYFVKQPETQLEVERACLAIKVCCVLALRYAGTDPAIIRWLGNTAEHSDYILLLGRLIFVGDKCRLSFWQRGWLWIRSWLRNGPIAPSGAESESGDK